MLITINVVITIVVVIIIIIGNIFFLFIIITWEKKFHVTLKQSRHG